MTFEAAALGAFANASATALNAGTLEILNSGSGVLVSVPLNTPAGSAAGAVTTFAGFPKTATATAGTAVSARYRTSTSANYKTGISVGIPGSGAQVIVDNGLNTLVFLSGQQVTVAANPTLTHSG